MLLAIHRIWTSFTNGVKPFDWFMWITEFVVVALIAYEIWGKEWRLKRALRRTFTLELDHGNVVKLAPDGRGEISATIKIGYRIEMNKFNFRFVEGKDGGNVPPEMVQIVHIVSKSRQTHDRLDSWTDGKGGCYGQWKPSPRHDKGEALHFALIVIASQQSWNGFLSFKSYDADGELHFRRGAITLTREGMLAGL